MKQPDLTGMDIAQIRALADQMDRRASEIDALLARLTRLVNGDFWAGADRERFVGEWRDRHAAGLRRIADGLQEASKHAREQARRQEWASRAH